MGKLKLSNDTKGSPYPEGDASNYFLKISPSTCNILPLFLEQFYN